jgi:hypothetical protein
MLLPESPVPAAVEVETIEIPGGVAADVTGAGFPGFPSQNALVVSPDGAWIAYMDPASDSVRLRDRLGREVIVDGASGGDVRFSADGRHAVAVADGTVVLVDLTSRTRRALGSLASIRWVEWIRTGVVVLHDGSDGTRVLTLLPLRGEPRTLATPASVTRFAAAPRGTRVWWFGGGSAFVVDAARPQDSPRRIGRVPGIVHNAEASPAGDRVAFVTERGVVAIDALGRRTAYRPESGVHSLWFRRDGSLSWASRSGATVVHGRRVARLPAPAGDLVAMRARDVVVAAVGSEVVRWDPRSGRRETLRTFEPDTRVVTADAWAGGVAAWTSRTTYALVRPY